MECLDILSCFVFLVHSFNVCHAKVAVGSIIGGFSPDHRNGKRHAFYFTRKPFSQRGRTSITNDVRCPELVLVSQFTTEVRIINFLNLASNPFFLINSRKASAHVAESIRVTCTLPWHLDQLLEV